MESMTVDVVIEEIMKIHKSLPKRPELEEIEAAKTLIRNIDREESLKIETISRISKGKGVPDELFYVYQEMQKRLVYYQTKQQKKEALELLDLENAHQVFDDLIQRASECISPGFDSGFSSSKGMRRDLGVGPSGSVLVSKDFDSLSGGGGGGGGGNELMMTSVGLNSKEPLIKGSRSGELFTRDDGFVKMAKTRFHADGFGGGSSSTTVPQIHDSTLKASISSGQDGEKMSLIKLASLIEVYAKKGTKELKLQSKLLDQVEWLPDSIGKLSSLLTLDLSENRIVAIPVTIGGLSSLVKLDLHSNRIAELPEAVGDLLNLVCLDLRGNYLTKIPAVIGRLVQLEELDLSSNQLRSLPETIGSLVNLKKLNVETNNVDELPHTIGMCSSLEELRVDYNKLKALPEAVGKIESLQVLTVRYNNIRQLPTTMSSLTKLRELDVSFNELESVPESLCFATSLVKLNISNNFANLRHLPRSIGNLEMLEVLDMSNNQIRILPDSFKLLTRLTVLYADQNPLEVPPRHIAEKGAKDVVLYMAEYVANKEVKALPVKQKKAWAPFCFVRRSKKPKHNGADFVKT